MKQPGIKIRNKKRQKDCKNSAAEKMS